jgi:hypothetical protein
VRLIERRIGLLSRDAVRLARCAAVAGQDFSVTLAAEVLDANPLDLADAWTELESAQVLRDGAFAHDLIFDAARAISSAMRRCSALLAQLLCERCQAAEAQEMVASRLLDWPRTGWALARSFARRRTWPKRAGRRCVHFACERASTTWIRPRRSTDGPVTRTLSVH